MKITKAHREQVLSELVLQGYSICAGRDLQVDSTTNAIFSSDQEYQGLKDFVVWNPFNPLSPVGRYKTVTEALKRL